jgi:translocation and assembly module TamB
LSRAARISLWTALVVLALIGAGAGTIYWLLSGEAGLEQVRALTLDQVNQALAGRGTITARRIRGSVTSGHLVFDSVSLHDRTGASVIDLARLEIDGQFGGILGRRIAIRRLVLRAPRVHLEQGRDSLWNVQRIFPRRTTPAPPNRWTVTIDSAEVIDGALSVRQLDTLVTLPLKERRFDALGLRAAGIMVMRPDSIGGHASLLALHARISLPPVELRDASGSVRWGRDTIRLDLPDARLPGTHASVAGTIVLGKGVPPRLDLAVRADTLDLKDIAWASSLIPRSGGRGVASLAVRSEQDTHLTAYAISGLDVRATQSHLTGGFTVVVGHEPVVRDLAVELAPLDLNLVRELFGDSVPKKSWQGAIRGSVRGSGGPISALRVDAMRLAYEDRRVPGAGGHLVITGMMDAKAKPSVLHGFAITIEDLDVRTVGAVAKAADSLGGTLSGRVVLDGPTSDLTFHDLLLHHADGDGMRSRVTGSGRIASDIRSLWMEADLSLDTIAVRTLARGRSALPLREPLAGTLAVRTIRDTMGLDLRLLADSGSVWFHGYSLLDPMRSVIRGDARLQRLDPRALIARRDIPRIVLDGTAQVAIDMAPVDTDAHVTVRLDSSSLLGEERVRYGEIRAGVDHRGVHVDTAEVTTASLHLQARGQLGRHGNAPDTLTFSVDIDSLAALRPLLLDSLGAPKTDSTGGALNLHDGRLIGSLDTLRIEADFGAKRIRWNGVSVRDAIGRAEVGGLPSAATGRVHLTASGAGTTALMTKRLAFDATVTDGTRGTMTGLIVSESADSSTIALHAVRSADSVRVRIDSLGLRLGASLWTLADSAALTMRGTDLHVDTLHLTSAGGGTVTIAGTMPDTGTIRARLSVDRLPLEELAFTGKLSPNLTGVARGELSVFGTRDAPLYTFTAALENVKFDEGVVPSLTADARYANRQLDATLVGGGGTDRELFRVESRVPVDLSLRSVRERMLDAPMMLRAVADSAPLAGVEALVPQVSQLAGTLTARLDLTGTWKQRAITGSAHIRNGAFTWDKSGTDARALRLDADFAHDTVTIRTLRMSDGDNPRDSIYVLGSIFKRDSSWQVALRSGATNFKVMDDPRVASVDAQWDLKIDGLLAEPLIGGSVTLPSATLRIGQQRQVRRLRDTTSFVEGEVGSGARFRALKVVLGNDVRLQSKDANVQLSGQLELGGDLKDPYLSGEILANRGTYRVDLGALKRTFRVDSGVVRVAGTLPIVAGLDIWTSYLVRRPSQDDITVGAHLTGTTDDLRLDLSSTTGGVTLAQSEIISYLLFGAPSFALDGQSQTTLKTATAAFLPTLGSTLESALGTVFPFFNSLQVSTVAGSNTYANLTSNPIDALLNNLAITGGRRVGGDGFLNLSAGLCRGARASAAQSSSMWFGIAAEYRPKQGVAAVASMDPGTNPCGTIGTLSQSYQFGLDLFKEWKH